MRRPDPRWKPLGRARIGAALLRATALVLAVTVLVAIGLRGCGVLP